ncbi:hypothetical protein QBC43DRAFT_290034 [Cladorrhinum sp. PSN259]|nr:hypothetical protein QBC43DRAFT_290034 [Cladorrhinum sp. PSN259]
MGIYSSVQVGEGEEGLRERVFVSESFQPVPSPLRRRCVRRSVPTTPNAEPTPALAPAPGPENKGEKTTTKAAGGGAAAAAATSTADRQPNPTSSGVGPQGISASSAEGGSKASSTDKGSHASQASSSATSSATGGVSISGANRSGTGNDSDSDTDGSGGLLPHETTSSLGPTATDGSIGSGKPGAGERKSVGQIIGIIGGIIAALLVLILVVWLGNRLWKNWKEKRILSLANRKPPTPSAGPLPFTRTPPPTYGQQEKRADAAGTPGVAQIGASIVLHELPGMQFDEPQELATPIVEVGTRSSNGTSFMASSFDAMSVDEMSMREMRPTSVI